MRLRLARLLLWALCAGTAALGAGPARPSAAGTQTAPGAAQVGAAAGALGARLGGASELDFHSACHSNPEHEYMTSFSEEVTTLSPDTTPTGNEFLAVSISPSEAHLVTSTQGGGAYVFDWLGNRITGNDSVSEMGTTLLWDDDGVWGINTETGWMYVARSPLESLAFEPVCKPVDAATSLVTYGVNEFVISGSAEHSSCNLWHLSDREDCSSLTCFNPSVQGEVFALHALPEGDLVVGIADTLYLVGETFNRTIWSGYPLVTPVDVINGSAWGFDVLVLNYDTFEEHATDTDTAIVGFSVADQGIANVTLSSDLIRWPYSMAINASTTAVVVSNTGDGNFALAAPCDPLLPVEQDDDTPLDDDDTVDDDDGSGHSGSGSSDDDDWDDDDGGSASSSGGGGGGGGGGGSNNDTYYNVGIAACILVLLGVFAYGVRRRHVGKPASELERRLLGDDDGDMTVERERWLIDESRLKRGGILGGGAFGQVFEGEFNGVTVAVKRLPVTLSDDALRRFAGEVRLLASLRHPYVLRFHGCCIPRERFEILMVMELCQRSLQDEIDDPEAGPLPLLRYSMEIAEAFAYLHANHVLHRDLKPENVLVHDDQHVRVADFGEARMMATAQTFDATTMAGTPGYMAPELISAASDTCGLWGGAADVYSFGILLNCMATRRRPFIEDISAGATVHDVLECVLSGGRPPLAEDAVHELLGVDVGERYRNLVRECWEQDPRQRPEFSEIIDVLRDMLPGGHGRESMVFDLERPSSPR